MKAVVLSAPNQVQVQVMPEPKTTQAGESIANVEFVGVCKTDQQLTTLGSEKDLVLGHEVVCRLPGSENYLALNNEISCGHCSYCAEGLTSHCLNLHELGVNEHGGYAEKIRAPQTALHPFSLNNPMLGIMIEPLSCAVRGVSRIITASKLLSVERPTVFVIGGGISGALVSYLLTNSDDFQGDLCLYDISPAPIPWAERLGIQRLENLEPDLVHVVVECSGSATGLATAFQIVRKAGLVCIYGVPKPDLNLPIAAHDLFSHEITVLTTFAGVTQETMAAAIAALQQDEAFFEQLLGQKISLQQLPEVLTSWSPQPGTRTVVDLNI